MSPLVTWRDWVIYREVSMTFPSKTTPLARMFDCAVMDRRVSWFLRQNTEAVMRWILTLVALLGLAAYPGDGRGTY